MSTSPSSFRRLEIERQVSEDGTPLLICRGRITLETSPEFRSQVKNLSREHKLVLADLSGVDSVDSSGLGSVLGTYVSAKSDGCELKLINVHPRVKDLLDITRLTQILQK